MEERIAHLCGNGNDTAKEGELTMQRGENCCGNVPE